MNDIDVTDRSASEKVAFVSKYDTLSMCCTKDKDAIDFSSENERLLYGFELKERNNTETEDSFDGMIRRGAEIIFEECSGKLFVYYKKTDIAYLVTIL